MREGERRRDVGKREVEEEEKAFSPHCHAESDSDLLLFYAAIVLLK